MKKWFTVTRLLVGVGIAAVGVIAGLAVASIGDDEGSRAATVSDQLGDADPAEGEGPQRRAVDDLGFGVGLATADLSASLREVVTASNGAARLQDAGVDALDRGFTLLEAGDGPGAEGAFDQQAGALIDAMDRAVEVERRAQARAEIQLEDLVALLDEAEGDLHELRPVAAEGRKALVATGDLVTLDTQVARRLGAMRDALLENRVARYQQQAFALIAVLDQAEAAGTAVNTRLDRFTAAVGEASEVLAGFGLDRVLPPVG